MIHQVSTSVNYVRSMAFPSRLSLLLYLFYILPFRNFLYLLTHLSTPAPQGPTPTTVPWVYLHPGPYPSNCTVGVPASQGPTPVTVAWCTCTPGPYTGNCTVGVPASQGPTPLTVPWVYLHPRARHRQLYRGRTYTRALYRQLFRGRTCTIGPYTGKCTVVIPAQATVPWLQCVGGRS